MGQEGLGTILNPGGGGGGEEAPLGWGVEN